MVAAEIVEGQTVVFRTKLGRGRRRALHVTKIERVSAKILYVYGTAVRISDGAHLGTANAAHSAVLWTTDEVELI